jgi:LacI family transcriptional regulator
MKRKCKVLILLGWNDPSILLALVRHAREADWHLETRHFFTETIPDGWRGDGLIVSNPQRDDLRRYILRQAPFQPTVLLGGNNPGVCAPQVLEDNRGAGRLVARHFLERGHKHFAWIETGYGQVVDERLAGFREALAAAGHVPETLTCPPGDWSLRRRRLLRLLQGLPRPLALLAIDDQLASEIIEVCVEEGLRVPEDVAVAGIGNIELACETSHVPITSVDLAGEETARAAAGMLDRLMRGAKPPAKPLVVPPNGLVVRRSSSAMVASDPTLLRAIEYIGRNLGGPLDIDSLAAAAGVSRRTLYNVFARELSRTPVDYLRNERMNLARGMLAGTDASITEIAGTCGFGTIRTLNRVFLEVEKTTPRAWRRAHRKDAP